MPKPRVDAADATDLDKTVIELRKRLKEAQSPTRRPPDPKDTPSRYYRNDRTIEIEEMRGGYLVSWTESDTPGGITLPHDLGGESIHTTVDGVLDEVRRLLRGD